MGYEPHTVFLNALDLKLGSDVQFILCLVT